MNKIVESIWEWPSLPPLPSCHEAVLLRMATSTERPRARQELRTVLREVLAAWSGLPVEKLPLRETSCGPIWEGQLAGQSLGIGLSYAGDAGWLGLMRGGLIGLDAMRPCWMLEMQAVAREYLGAAALERIEQSADPVTAFAASWTQLEARVKCFQRGLTEWTDKATAYADGACFQETIAFTGKRL